MERKKENKEKEKEKKREKENIIPIMEILNEKRFC